MPLITATDQDRRFMAMALAEARESFARASVPVGSIMVLEQKVIATGRNRSLEANDPTSHGETDCLRNAGTLEDYSGITLYTTLSPCMMCTGAMLFLGIPRLVIGDRENYPGDIDFLLQRGLQVAVLDDPDCIALMRRFTIEHADVWHRIISRGGTEVAAAKSVD
jgi:cytosine/creatinine deaminase